MTETSIYAFWQGVDGKYGILLLFPDSFGRSGKEGAVARSNGKYWSRVESYALEDQLLTVKRVLLAGAGMTEKYSLSLYVSVFQSVVKVGRFSVYRYSAHAAARLRKVRRERPEIARLRKVERASVERASVRSELGYGASEAHVWKSRLRKVMRKGRKNAHLRKVGGGRRGRVGQDRV